MGPNVEGNRPADEMRIEDQGMCRRVRLTVGLGPGVRGEPIPLHDLAAAGKKLFGFKYSSISKNRSDRADIRLGARYQNPTEPKARRLGKRLPQDSCAEAATPRAWANAITDIASFVSQRLGQRMADIRHSHDLGASVNEPICGMWNKSAG